MHLVLESTHWNYAKGEKVEIKALSNLPELTLTVNGKTVSTMKSDEQGMFVWEGIEFKKGNIEIIGSASGKTINAKVVTHQESDHIDLSTQITKNTGNTRLVIIKIEMQDKKGNTCFSKNDTLTLSLNGLATWCNYSGDVVLSNGKGELMLKSKEKEGELTITCDQLLESNKLKIDLSSF